MKFLTQFISVRVGTGHVNAGKLQKLGFRGNVLFIYLFIFVFLLINYGVI
jgi:hypothetical protein